MIFSYVKLLEFLYSISARFFRFHTLKMFRGLTVRRCLEWMVEIVHYFEQQSSLGKKLVLMKIELSFILSGLYITKI